MNKVNFSNDLIILPFSKIFFRLAIPNLFSTLMSSATVIFDLWYIGLIGMSELAGVAYIFPIFMLTSMLSNGAFGGAISGATARAFGSKNIFQAECIFRSAVLIAISFSIIMMFLFFSFAETFFSSFIIDSDVIISTLSYGNILLMGIILIWLFNIIIAVTRGSGNTLVPAIGWFIVLFSHIIMASLNLDYNDGQLFLKENIKLFDEKIIFSALEWAAISLLTGYFIGIVFVLYFYSMCKHSYSFIIKDFFKLNGIINLFKSGMLAGCQSLMTISLAIFCTIIIGSFGTDWAAGFGIAIRLELLLIPIIFGIGGALIAIVGANVGAKKFLRAVKMTWKGTFISVFIVGFIGLFFSIYPNLWSSLFTESVEIHETSKLYLQVVAPFYAFFALGLGLYFTCQAFNTLFWPVVGTFIRLIFVILSTFLLFNFNIDSPYLVFVTMALGLIIYGLFISLSLQLGPWKKYYNLG